MRSTIDLDREVREVLRDRAGSAGDPPILPARVTRRVRIQQITVVVGIAFLIAVVSIPLVLAPRLFRHEDRTEHGGHLAAPITSTVYGVSITYPDDWTLLQLNDRLRIGGVETSSLFQLSNFDPFEGNHWLCPLPSGRFPEGGVLLFAYEILDDPAAEPSWPVELHDGRGIWDTCTRRVARWQVGGRTFEAGVIGDLDGAAYGDLVEAFRSMTFEAPDEDEPLGAQDVTVGDAYVLASGRENGEPWNLLAFQYHDVSDNVLCVLLDPIGPRESSCIPNPVQNDGLAFDLSATQVGGTLFAFGKVPSDAEDVRTIAGRSLTLHPLPAGLRFPFDAFVGPADEEVADGARLVEVRLLGSAGDVIDRQQWIEPASVEAGAPGVKAFGHAFGQLWWLYDDGERIYLKVREGWIRRTGTRLLRGGEHLHALSHTFQQETDAGVGYDTVVFGVSSGEATQVTVVLATGETLQASTRTLEAEIHGPDLIELGHVFWLSIPGAVRGEIVAMDTGCRVLARQTLQPDTPPPSLPSPPPQPELPCIGP